MIGPVIGPAVLGVDPSLTRTGIAIIARGDTVARPVVLTDIGWEGTAAASYDERLDRIEALIGAILATINRATERGADIVGIAIEGPIYHGKLLPSFFDRAILFGALTSQLRRLAGRRTPWVVINPATREKFITGVGRAGDKERVLAEMRAAWKPAMVANHDQADALGLATAYAIHLGWPMPFRLRRCHVENVALITWPTTTPKRA